MVDRFNGARTELDSPARDCFAITPNDSTDFTHTARAVYVGVAGDVAVETVEGSTVTFVGAAAGSILPVRCKKVLSTGTTATSLVGME